ncbi:YncE family protein [Hydrotalea sp.]|uniref:YncE family protein n=1 Tax=Hydrotalea sp. TaxID=2881279 RepID=UPI00263286D2|nr:YncE family protein [Hydrotalea sp.]
MKPCIYCNRSRSVVRLVLILLSCTITAHAQTATQRILLAISKASHTLAMVNPENLQVIAQIPVGSDPHEVIASADGKTAYVSIYGGGTLHTLNVIDLVAQKPLPDIDTQPLLGPHGLTFVNGTLWFTAEGSKCVGRYNPANQQFDWVMGTGQDRTHMIYVTPNGKEVYTTNVASGTVSVLSETMFTPFTGAPAHKDWTQTIIPTAKGAEGMDVSPNGEELWTASSENGNIYIIHLTTKKAAAIIDAKIAGANRLKFTPDGKMVFISSLKTGYLAIYDANTHKEIKRLALGRGAAGILMDAVQQQAFVACSADDYIAVIGLGRSTIEVYQYWIGCVIFFDASIKAFIFC